MAKSFPRTMMRTTPSVAGDPWERLAYAVVVQAFKDACYKSSERRGHAKWWLLYSREAEIFFDALNLDRSLIPQVLREYGQN